MCKDFLSRLQFSRLCARLGGLCIAMSHYHHLIFDLFSLKFHFPFLLGLTMNNCTKTFIKRPGNCFSLFLSQEKNVENILVTVIYACLIPLIIGANLLLIIGIIKTKRNRFTSSKILFLALFLSDMTLGAVQLPLEIYLIWKSANPTCLEIDLSDFLIVFPISMSGNILCVIPIDRYIHVGHNRHHEQIVTKRLLAIIITLMILISFAWAASITLFYVNFVVFTLTAFQGTIFVLGFSFNVAVLINVRLQTKNSSAQHTTLNANLTKTISLIATIILISFIPLVVHLNVIEYVFANGTDVHSVVRVMKNLRWTMIPCQINAVLNSVIYFTRNSRMKRYYYNLLNFKNNKE